MDQSLLGNRYQLFEPLGVGGMGTVYRASDRLIGEQVALKRVSLPQDENEEATQRSTGGSADSRLALAQEFKILAALRHPNVIQVLDYGFDADRQPYFTMSLLEKPQNIVALGKEQPFDVQIGLLFQLLQALAYLHRQHILHRDLKPSNVLVSDGVVKVLDFGLALGSHGEDRFGEERLVGTIAYMAPELLQGEHANTASDLYAVGIMVYEIFTGRHPFGSHDTSTLIADILNSVPDFTSLNFTKRITAHSALLPATVDLTLLNERMVKIVQRLLNKDPGWRYGAAEEVISDLAAALDIPVPDEPAAIRESYLQAAKFVGRLIELNQMEQALREAIQGHGSAWLIAGESGVGKSRFMDELSHRAMIGGMLVLRGQPRAGLPSHFWHDAVRHLAVATDLDEMTASVLKAIVPNLGKLLNRPIPDAPELEGAAWQQRLTLAIVGLFHQCAIPGLLLLDDLQWAQESLDPLKHLNREVANSSLIIVGSYRSDEYPKLPESLPGMRVLPLQRFSSTEVTDLSQAMLGRIGAQSELVERLQRETEGNAFFLVEIVRTLAQQAGRLSQITAISLPEKILPNGVQTLLQSRLERIPEEARFLLKAVAIAGRQIDLAVVGRLTSKADSVPKQLKVDDWLTYGVNAALINREVGRWQFIHDKLRDALLAVITPDEWKSFGRQIAEAVEYVYPENLNYAGLLADLWHHAQDSEREQYYALLASYQALAESSAREALTLAQRALKLIPEMSTRAIPLHRLLGDIYWGMSSYPEAKARYETCLALAERANDQHHVALALKGLGEVAWRQSDYTAAQNYFEKSLLTSRAVGQSHEVARVLQSLGWVSIHQGDYPKAETYYHESLVLCRETGAILATAEALRGLGEVAVQLRNHSAARTYYEEALTLARKTGDRRAIAGCCRGLGEVAQYQGDMGLARSCFEELLATMRQIGDPRGVSMALFGLGVIAIQQGDYNTARGYYLEGLALCRAINARRGIVTNLCNLAYIELKLDHQTLAEQYASEALIIANESEDLPVVLNVLAVYAWLFHAKGENLRSVELVQTVSGRPETPAYAVKLIEPLRPDPSSSAGEAVVRPVETLVAEILTSNKARQSES